MLGFWLHQQGKADTWVKRIITQINQVTHMMKRISRKRHGVKEHELLRMFEAFIIPRIMYAAPYMRLTRTQIDKLETQIRKPIRVALGLPNYTPLHEIRRMGVHTPLSVRIDIHKEAQDSRLRASRQGRAILRSLGAQTEEPEDNITDRPPWEHLPRLTVHPIPRHMSVENDTERRAYRARATRYLVAQKIEQGYTPVYTDAAVSEDGIVATAAYYGNGQRTRRFMGIHNPGHAEALAIADAITNFTGPRKLLILTDSQDAIRLFCSNKIATHVRNILEFHLTSQPELWVELRWIPGHQGIPGNVAAHRLAREALFRESEPPIALPEEYDRHTIRAEERKARHEKLVQLRTDESTHCTPPISWPRWKTSCIRRAQAGVLRTPHIIHYVENKPGHPICPRCRHGYPNNQHYMWDCPEILQTRHTHIDSLSPSPGTWAEWLDPPEDPQKELKLALRKRTKFIGRHASTARNLATSSLTLTEEEHRDKQSLGITGNRSPPLR